MSGPGHEVQSCPVSLGDGDRGSQDAARSLVDGGKLKLSWSFLKFSLKAAMRGEVEVLPVINLDPQETVMEESHSHQGAANTLQGQNECSEASGSQDS